uniref:acireductone dioxygenase (Fe(2+)-requiring) n=1 Tax=Heterorhabditis bacteriophora TaxID=37862 RepID=A0A1I7WJM8_HETBA
MQSSGAIDHITLSKTLFDNKPELKESTKRRRTEKGRADSGDSGHGSSTSPQCQLEAIKEFTVDRPSRASSSSPLEFINNREDRFTAFDIIRNRSVLYPSVALFFIKQTLEKLAKVYEMMYRDEVHISPSTMPDYEKKIFFEEHMHKDPELRFIKEGSGFFDVRSESSNPKWEAYDRENDGEAQEERVEYLRSIGKI